ncbi:MAG: hypothetical protein KatS3mg132_302 [Limisphaera sp.]|nr:MAG: hypothetical protein KatS3mg132_302 [Limisphaera sp.]
MKRFWLAIWFCLVGLGFGADAQGPDQQYIHIYSVIREGDRLLELGQTRAALAKYLEARQALQQFEKSWPDWNPRIVQFRLNYLATQIARASAGAPEAGTVPPASTTPQPAAVAESVPAAWPAPDPALLREIEALRQEVAQLHADKALLEARLREALSVQPAGMDPRELAKAQARIRDLEKERDLLRAALEEAQRRSAAPEPSQEIRQLREELEQTRRQLAEQTELARRLAREKAVADEQLTAHGLAAARELRQAQDRIAALEQELARLQERVPAAGGAATDASAVLQQELQHLQQQLAEQTERADTLARENRRLQEQLAAPRAAASPEVLEKLEQALRETRRQLEEQQLLNRQLAAEKAALNEQLNRLRADAETLETLRAENAVLKQQLARLTAEAARGTNTLEALRQSQLRLATLESDLDILRLEKAALEQRLLNARSNEVARAQAHAEAVATLRARLAALEAEPVPFTAEELALLRAADPAPLTEPDRPSPGAAGAAPATASTAPRAPAPPEVEKRLEQARRAFEQGDLEAAGGLYSEILQQSPRHPTALANLALVELRRDRPEEALPHAEAAARLAPGDARVRSVLGQVYLRLGRYDDAVDAFSRAAELDPRSAEVQNYLGLALSHKGLRAAAETALRRAILLEPGYAAAHHNLAVFYLHRDPPLLELARWHYQKARAGGFPPNPELEAALNPTASRPSS